MDPAIILGCLLIALARIIDVSLGTLRMMSVVNGRAKSAWLLGFFEVLVWILAASHVFNNLNQPVYALSYALGYATGNYVGIVLERYMALGSQVVRVFTHQGGTVAAALRESGYKVTEFEGQGRDGRVSLLFLEIQRKNAPVAVHRARELDADCFVVIDDIRYSSAAMRNQGLNAVRAIAPRK